MCATIVNLGLSRRSDRHDADEFARRRAICSARCWRRVAQTAMSWPRASFVSPKAKCARNDAALWVKICGLTTPEAVAAAVEAGVDAVGFVFAESKRKVTAQHAAELARDVPKHIVRVAVMLHPSQAAAR